MIPTSRGSSLGFWMESESPPLPLPFGVTPGSDLPLFLVSDGDCADSSGAFLRQTVLFTAYETPETRALFNKSLKNVAGKIRSEHFWPPLQVPEGVEPVGTPTEPHTTLLTIVTRASPASIVQVRRMNSTSDLIILPST
jgi:hypothetical protein